MKVTTLTEETETEHRIVFKSKPGVHIFDFHEAERQNKSFRNASIAGVLALGSLGVAAIAAVMGWV